MTDERPPPLELPLDRIVVAGRHRTDLGDIQGLARSMQAVGLLHPVVVTPDHGQGRGHQLIAGQRRIAAARALGWTVIPARVIDLDDLLAAERDENTVRKDFTPTEAVAIGLAIEQHERPKARERAYAGALRGAKIAAARRSGKPDPDIQDIQPSEKFTEGWTGNVRDIASEAVGMSGPTYARAKRVVAAAEADPERFGDLPVLMDERTVTTAHTELRRRGGDTTTPTGKQPSKPKPASKQNGKANGKANGKQKPRRRDLTDAEITAMADAAERQTRAAFAYDTLERLARCPFEPAQVAAAVPAVQRFRVDTYLKQACEWLETFRAVWTADGDAHRNDSTNDSGPANRA